METILFSSSSNPILNLKSIFSKSPSLPRHNKPIISSVLKKPIKSNYSSFASQNKFWFSFLHHGLAAAAISIAINFCPLETLTGHAIASEFDVLNDGPPTESYVVDDAGVLSRVTKSDLKRMFSDLESRKNLHVNFITVRKLTAHRANKFQMWRVK